MDLRSKNILSEHLHLPSFFVNSLYSDLQIMFDTRASDLLTIRCKSEVEWYMMKV